MVVILSVTYPYAVVHTNATGNKPEIPGNFYVLNSQREFLKLMRELRGIYRSVVFLNTVA